MLATPHKPHKPKRKLRAAIDSPPGGDVATGIMPDDTNPPNLADFSELITPEVGQRLTAILQQKIGESPCEMCGNKRWLVASNFVSPALLSVDFRGNQFGTLMAKLHPCAMVQCSNCGNTKLHSLHYLGFDVFAKDGGNE